MFLFQILSAFVCLCGGSQINHYTYIPTVRLSNATGQEEDLKGVLSHLSRECLLISC